MFGKGRILKGIGGFYYIKSNGKVYESRASSLLRLNNLTPTVGDYVEFEYTNDNKAYIKDIIDRKNIFIRPPVANVDEVLLIASVLEPKYNLQLIDRMILLSRFNGVEPKIVINKKDLDGKLAHELAKSYKNSGFKVLITSKEDKNSINKIREIISKKTIVFMGTSGVGKSTLVSKLTNIEIDTGAVSKKTSRGRHTTRHVEMFEYAENSYYVDTPGFSSLSLDFIEDIYQLEALYHEFRYFGQCKFSNCFHINEPNCSVKDALENKRIVNFRYENYVYFHNEIINRR